MYYNISLMKVFTLVHHQNQRLATYGFILFGGKMSNKPMNIIPYSLQNNCTHHLSLNVFFAKYWYSVD